MGLDKSFTSELVAKCLHHDTTLPYDICGIIREFCCPRQITQDDLCSMIANTCTDVLTLRVCGVFYRRRKRRKELVDVLGSATFCYDASKTQDCFAVLEIPFFSENAEPKVLRVRVSFLWPIRCAVVDGSRVEADTQAPDDIAIWLY